MDTCPNLCQQKGWPPLRVCKCERGEAPVSNRTCDPSTIKGAKFSLLCCQPEAVPQSSGTLNLKFALMTQCPPLTWNGQVFLQTPGTLFLTPPTIPLSRVLAHYRGCPPTWSIFYVYFQCLSCIHFYYSFMGLLYFKTTYMISNIVSSCILCMCVWNCCKV